jgi:lipopolysaccharide export system ATP-binding protein
MIVGLIPPDGRRITLDGEDITGCPCTSGRRASATSRRSRPSSASSPSRRTFWPSSRRSTSPPRSGSERLETLLDELKIKHLRLSKAFQLSGGERRRLEITRALVTQPKFMMLDEPFAGVDPIAVNDIQKIVASLRYRGIGVLISDHNVEQTLDIVDRAYIMYDGTGEGGRYRARAGVRRHGLPRSTSVRR